MAKRKQQQQKEPTQEQQQPYDNVLKSLLEDQEEQMLPYFLAGVVYLETLNIEVLRTPLRVDRVYKVFYRGQVHILHLEFESGSSKNMESRLLNYHAYLHDKYGYPVISIIVYPFETTMAVSPFLESSGDKELLVFHFQVLPLWKLSAEQYLSEHAVTMYALLPAMEGANSQLLNQAIDELIAYYKGNAEKLAQEFRWLGIILRRAEVMPLPDKQEIEERLSMYDELTENDPKMKKIRAASKAEGRAEALAEAAAASRALAAGLQNALVTVVEGRFPPLTELAQQKVTRIDKPDALNMLLKGIAAAPDEAAARLILELLAA